MATVAILNLVQLRLYSYLAQLGILPTLTVPNLKGISLTVTKLKHFKNFKMATAAILNFGSNSNLQFFRTTWNTTHFYCTKFEGGISHRYQVIAFQTKSKWRQPPSWILDHLR